MHIYTDVIPEIKKAYAANYADWNTNQRDAFRIEIANMLKTTI